MLEFNLYLATEEAYTT